MMLTTSVEVQDLDNGLCKVWITDVFGEALDMRGQERTLRNIGLFASNLNKQLPWMCGYQWNKVHH